MIHSYAFLGMTKLGAQEIDHPLPVVGGGDAQWSVECALLADDVRRAPPAFEHPLPVVGGGDSQWNVERCFSGKHCENSRCKYWHSDSEKRCKRYALGGCDMLVSGRCPDGLHVDVSDIKLTCTVDLERPAQAVARLRDLEAQPSECAKYVRIVVYGFAAIRSALLKKFLEALPLLHEIALPDRARDPTLLVFLCDLVEQCAKSNPRLQDAIFEDKSMEALW